MKKIVLVLMLWGLGHAQVMSQNFLGRMTKNLSSGFKAESNISNFIISGMPDAKSNIKIGTAFGGFVKLDITEHFAMQGDVFALYKTSTIKKGDIRGKYEYGGLEIPIYAMRQWNMNEGQRSYFGIGPYAEWGLNTILKIGKSEIDLYEKNEATNKAYMKKLGFGFAVFIGYEFRDGTQINIGYKISITNALEEDRDKASIHSNIVSLGVAYRFK